MLLSVAFRGHFMSAGQGQGLLVYAVYFSDMNCALLLTGAVLFSITVGCALHDDGI